MRNRGAAPGHTLAPMHAAVRSLLAELDADPDSAPGPDDRLLLGKPTIISTNLTTEDIAKRYTPQIASRLRGSFKRVPFIGDDIRLLKNGGML